MTDDTALEELCTSAFICSWLSDGNQRQCWVIIIIAVAAIAFSGVT